MKQAKAVVYKRGGTWYHDTYIGDRVVHSDNTGDWRIIFDQAFLSATAFDFVNRTGHRIRYSWKELVDRA